MAAHPTKDTGDATEATVLAAFVSAGVAVSIPYGENHRYDLIVDVGGRLWRVQAKTGRRVGETVSFRTCSYNPYSGHRGYADQIDLFAVHCREIDRLFLVPVNEAPTREARLRLSPARNNQLAGIRLADTYDFDRQLAALSAAIDPTRSSSNG